MKKLQYLSVLSLVFLISSGIYGIIIGIHYTNEYFHLTEELRNQTDIALTIGSLTLSYFSGTFRGIITFVCGLIGIINIHKKEVETKYLVYLGILTLFYILGLKKFPYVEEFVQMLVAVFSFATLIIFKVMKCYNTEDLR